MDDTLFRSSGYVIETTPSGNKIQIPYDKWLTHVPTHKDSRFDYSNFRCVKTFIDTSEPIGDNWNKILSLGAAEGHKAIVTAREPFDNQMYFVYHLKHKLNDENISIYCVGDEPYNTAAECKYHVIDRLLIGSKYTGVVMVDDSEMNLEYFLKLKERHPSKMFTTYLVNGESIRLYAVR